MSRSVRELHLLRYGATTSQLHKGLSEPPDIASKAEINNMVQRLHANKGGRSNSQQTYRSRQQRDSTATANMSTLFPCFSEPSSSVGKGRPPVQDEDLYGLTINKPIVSGDEVPSYPVDWRRNPSCAHDDDTLRWLYLCVTLPLLPSQEAVTSETIKAIDRLLAHHDVPMVASGTRRKDVRSMLRDSRRYGLLIDIISTRRTVMSGTPHAAASNIYRHCEERYPIYIKFVFVGITDNGTKRVARDIFSGGRVPVFEPQPNNLHSSRSQHGRQSAPLFSGSKGKSDANSILVSSEASGGKAMPFTSVDSVHCFVAHPKSDEADLLRIKGEQERHQKEAERVARRFTPKYVPPPPPEWLQHLIESEIQNRTPTRKQQAYHYYNEISRPSSDKGKANEPDLEQPDTQAADEHILMDGAEGQWLFGKSFGGSTVLQATSASRPEDISAQVSQVGAYLPSIGGSPIPQLRPASDDSFTSLPAKSMPPQTKEQHYLTLAQQLASRLRERNTTKEGRGGPSPLNM